MKQALPVVVLVFVVWLIDYSYGIAESGVDARTVNDDVVAPRRIERPGQSCRGDAPRFVADSKSSVQRLIGSRVINPIEEYIGVIADLMLDRCGRINMMVLRVGGFMGFGARYAHVSLDEVRIEVAERDAEMVIVMRETREHIFNEHGTLQQSE